LLKLRGEHEDRFLVVEMETPLFRDRELNLRYSLTEAGARAVLKKLGLADDEIEASVAASLNGPYFGEA
jgi:hypothetical protein